MEIDADVGDVPGDDQHKNAEYGGEAIGDKSGVGGFASAKYKAKAFGFGPADHAIFEINAVCV